jgi:hypothetical protein
MTSTFPHKIDREKRDAAMKFTSARYITVRTVSDNNNIVFHPSKAFPIKIIIIIMKPAVLYPDHYQR